MAADTRFEDRPERASLADTELDGVVGGDGTNMMQTLSACLRMMADLQKSITANIR